MPTRISRASSLPSPLSFQGSTVLESGSDAAIDSSNSETSQLETSRDAAESALARSVTLEMRAAFTHVTIAQLAYDMGQIERGDQAYLRAQEACTAAQRLNSLLRPLGRDTIQAQLEFLFPVLEACRQQRSDFHPSLRQPSLS